MKEDKKYLYFDNYRISGDAYSFKLERKKEAKTAKVTYGDPKYYPILSQVINSIGQDIVRTSLSDLVEINNRITSLEEFVKDTFDSEVDYRTFLK